MGMRLVENGPSLRTVHLIEVVAERGKTGLVYATSPQMKGLLVAAATEEEAVSALPDAISGLLKAAGDPSLVLPAKGRDGILGTWVGIPNDMVEQALAHRA